MNIKKFKNDVRGAALVYVIVTAAVLVLLGAATTATAYANLRATQIQEQSDNNFYSADSVMNAIVSGLEGDISKAYEAAYTKVMTNLNNYPDNQAAVDDFKETFLFAIRTELNDGDESFSFMYQVSRLQKYAEAILRDDISYTISAINGNNYLDITENGVILRNLHVTYEDDSGYFDEITTDVKIAIPTFDPSVPPPVKPVAMNAIVIDDGLEINTNKGLQIYGDTYINERESDKSAILLNTHTSLHIMTPTELIAGGFIQTIEDAKLTFETTSEQKACSNKIWTENFDFGRHTTAIISGATHVYDDLEVNGAYSNVKLAGQYYGYSAHNKKADDSSAININGAKTSLDIENLDALVLAGTSYISTSGVIEDHPTFNNDPEVDIQLGEALSVKSNQIAYLVDDKEFVSFDADGGLQRDVPGFVSNPMSYAQYEKMIGPVANGGNGSAAEAFRKILNKTLSYGKSYKDFGAEIVPIFSSKDNGTVYLYLSISDTSKAADYFVTVYKGNSLLSQRLRTYAAQYLTALRFSDETAVIVNQNYINTAAEIINLYTYYSETNIPAIKDGLGYNHTTVTPERQAEIDAIMAQYRKDYLDDGTVAGNGEKYKVMYEKMIDEDQLRTFISDATKASARVDHHTNNNIETIANGVIMHGTSGAKAIIVDNAGKAPYELGSGSGLVITTGDLYITDDWTGTIIVGGRAYCTNGTQENPVNITVSKEIVESVVPLYFTIKEGSVERSMMVLNIFTAYKDFMVNNATDDEGINADMLSTCITFTNWDRY